MLTGRRAFDGDDVAEVLASVIKGTADVGLLPSDVHPGLRRVIDRCLQKDVLKRFRDIGDVRFEIQAILDDPLGLTFRAPSAGESRPLWRRALPIVATGLLMAGAAVVTWNTRPAEQPQEVTRFPLIFPEGECR